MLVLGACYSKLLISLSSILPPRFLSRHVDVSQRAPADCRCLFFHPFASSTSPKLFHFTAVATGGTSTSEWGLNLVLCWVCLSLLARSPLPRLIAWGTANSFLPRSPLCSGLAEHMQMLLSSPCTSSRLIPLPLLSLPSRFHRSLIAYRKGFIRASCPTPAAAGTSPAVCVSTASELFPYCLALV